MAINLGQQLRQNLLPTVNRPTVGGMYQRPTASSMLAQVQQQQNQKQQGELLKQAQAAAQAGQAFNPQNVTGALKSYANQLANQVQTFNQGTQATQDLLSQWFPGAGIFDPSQYKLDPGLANLKPTWNAEKNVINWGSELPMNIHTGTLLPYWQQGVTSQDVLGQAQMRIPGALMQMLKDPNQKSELYSDLNKYAAEAYKLKELGKQAYYDYAKKVVGQVPSYDIEKYKTDLTKNYNDAVTKYENVIKSLPAGAMVKQPADYLQFKYGNLNNDFVWKSPYTGVYHEVSPQLKKFLDSYSSLSDQYNQAKGNLSTSYESAYDTAAQKYTEHLGNVLKNKDQYLQGALGAASQAIQGAMPKDLSLGSILEKYVDPAKLREYALANKDKATKVWEMTGATQDTVKYIDPVTGKSYLTSEEYVKNAPPNPFGVPTPKTAALTPEEAATKQAQIQKQTTGTKYVNPKTKKTYYNLQDYKNDWSNYEPTGATGSRNPFLFGSSSFSRDPSRTLVDPITSDLTVDEYNQWQKNQDAAWAAMPEQVKEQLARSTSPTDPFAKQIAAWRAANI